MSAVHPEAPEAQADEIELCRARLRHLVELERRDANRSEEHTSELQSLRHLVCRLLLAKKKSSHKITSPIVQRIAAMTATVSHPGAANVRAAAVPHAPTFARHCAGFGWVGRTYVTGRPA